MSDERREYARFPVNWRGRVVLLPVKDLYEVAIVDISQGGVGILFSHALTCGASVSVEFYVRYKGKMEAIRAKTRVAFNTVLADNRGAKLGLQFTAMSKDHMHVLANVLHMLEDARS